MESKRINWSSDSGLFLIRVILGVVFVYHGSQKLFGMFDGASLGGFARYLETLKVPYPAVAAVLAGSAEFLGGLALITGYGMRTMTVPLITTMGVACFLVHRDAFSIQHNGLEYPLTLGVVLVGLFLTGPGRFTVGRLFPDEIMIDEAVAEERRKTRSEPAKPLGRGDSTARTEKSLSSATAAASPALERKINDRINSLTRTETSVKNDSSLLSDSGAIADINARVDSLLADAESRGRNVVADATDRVRDTVAEIKKPA
ncbi:MAG: DoxX family protein [Planctomycetota bacterium]